MKVSLINFTPEARELLIFTKGTRLGVDAARWEDVWQMTDAEKESQLAYMAETIPSSWEFVDYVFLVEGVSRAYTHQQVRTRAGSYAQQSMRVTDMADFDYVFPERVRRDKQAMKITLVVLDAIREGYRALRETGTPAEDARGILPTNIATNIVCKFNLRTMSELAKSRTGGRTQGEYIEVVNAMCDLVLAEHPWAERFLFPAQRDHFAEIEAFAEKEFGGDLLRKGELLKIVDKLRKEA